MRDRDYQDSCEFLRDLFGQTEHNIELRALSAGKPPATLKTRSPEEAVSFCRRHDGEHDGIFFGVATRRRGATDGTAKSVVECPALWVDIDCVKQGIGGQEAIDALNFLPHPPSTIVNSGNGLHAYWYLEEPLTVSPDQDAVIHAIEQALRSLARALAGDTTCAEVARVMRLPGTVNAKKETLEREGEPVPCEVIEARSTLYDFNELAEWLESQRAVLQATIKAPDRAVEQDNPYVAYARKAGFEPAIDISAALDAMEHGGTDETSIHQTQLRVSASMLARGYDDDEIVERILAATEKAAPHDAAWNWQREERAIRKMVETGRAKGFAEKAKGARAGSSGKPPKTDEKGANSPGQGPAADPAPDEPSAPPTEGNLAVVHDIAQERLKREIEDDRKSQIVAVGQSVIGVWQDRYGPLLHAQGSTWAYSEGVWELWSDAHDQRLKSMVQGACHGLELNPAASLLSGAYRYVMERPELTHDDIEFDMHGLLVAADGVLDIETFEIGEHDPEHFATRKIEVPLAGPREYPTWLRFLSSAFSDRDDVAEIISTLQEWFGVSLVGTRKRELLKGLLVHGPSRSGKTQIAYIIRALLGPRHVCNARMRDLEGRFGLQPLIGKRGWIADDAVGPRETLDAEAYKVIVTGEDTSAQVKGGKNWEGRFGFPVLLTSNNLPRVDDKSDATYNRSLILPMTVVHPPKAPGPEGYDSISEKIIAEELTGVFWWAIEGWQRAKERGTFDPPRVMRDAGALFQASNDPTGTWIRECVEICDATKVARKDLACSFNGWWSMEADDAKPFASNSVIRALREHYPHIEDNKVMGERFFGGIKLNDDGLFAWESRFKDDGYGGYAGGHKGAYSSTREEVNRPFSKRNEDQKEGASNVDSGKKDFTRTRF